MKQIMITVTYAGKRQQVTIAENQDVLRTIANVAIILGGIHTVVVEEAIVNSDGSARLYSGHKIN
jgi:hypothetical protein